MTWFHLYCTTSLPQSQTTFHMRSTLLLAVVLMVWVGQCRTDGDGETIEDSADPKKEVDDAFYRLPAKPKDDEDEVDEDPNALDDASCDELWDQTMKEDEKMFTDEIVEWTNLCALKNGLCPLGEPYGTSGLMHKWIQFSYRHDVLTIKTKVTTTFEERCSNPAVDWEKIGEKYKMKDQLRNMKRYKKPYNVYGKRRHQRRSKSSKPE